MWYENKAATVGPEVNSININEYEVEEIVLEEDNIKGGSDLS